MLAGGCQAAAGAGVLGAASAGVGCASLDGFDAVGATTEELGAVTVSLLVLDANGWFDGVLAGSDGESMPLPQPIAALAQPSNSVAARKRAPRGHEKPRLMSFVYRQTSDRSSARR